MINIYRNYFAELLNTCDCVISMAGTAAEQAVGLAKPVIQVTGQGPQFTANFAEAQRRLLGPTVFGMSKKRTNSNIFDNEIDFITDSIFKLSQQQFLRNECRKESLLRLGSFGASERIASSINTLVQN